MNHLPAVKNSGKNGIHCQWWAPMIKYLINKKLYKQWDDLVLFYIYHNIVFSYGCGQQWNYDDKK